MSGMRGSGADANADLKVVKQQNDEQPKHRLIVVKLNCFFSDERREICSVEFLHWRANLTQNVSLYFVYLKIEVFVVARNREGESLERLLGTRKHVF